jgi:hypothetical protein
MIYYHTTHDNRLDSFRWRPATTLPTPSTPSAAAVSAAVSEVVACPFAASATTAPLALALALRVGEGCPCVRPAPPFRSQPSAMHHRLMSVAMSVAIARQPASQPGRPIVAMHHANNTHRPSARVAHPAARRARSHSALRWPARTVRSVSVPANHASLASIHAVVHTACMRL